MSSTTSTQEPRRVRRFWKMQLAATGASLVLFTAFWGVYLCVFPAIEQADPRNYLENVKRALADNEQDRALAISRTAADHLLRDPEPRKLYADLLLGSGQREEAREQYLKVTRIDHMPPPYPAPTRRSYYDPETRLALGRLTLENGTMAEPNRLVNAARHFELGGVYEDLSSSAFLASHDVLMETYAGLGQWGRAARYGEPDAGLLREAGPDGVEAAAATAAWMDRWCMVQRLAKHARERWPESALAPLLEGRVHMHDGDTDAAVAAFAEAFERGHRDSGYLLGLALEKAGRLPEAAAAFAETSTESVYRIAALAKAADCADPDGAAGFRRKAREALTELTREGQVVMEDPVERFQLMGCAYDAPLFRRGGVFPLCALWQDTAHEQGDDVWRTVATAGGARLDTGGYTLIVQPAWNFVACGALEGLPEQEDALFPWPSVESPRMGTEDGICRLRLGEGGNHFVEVVHAGSEAATLVKLIPFSTEPGRTYLAGGRWRGEPGEAVLQFMAYQRACQPVRWHSSRTRNDCWQQMFLCVRGNVLWDEACLRLLVSGEAAAGAYDDLMAVELVHPEKGLEGAPREQGASKATAGP